MGSAGERKVLTGVIVSGQCKAEYGGSSTIASDRERSTGFIMYRATLCFLIGI